MKATSTFFRDFLPCLLSAIFGLFLLNGCNTSIIRHAQDGDYSAVLDNLNDSQDTMDVQQALCWASRNGHRKVVELLVQKGAKINYRIPRARASVSLRWDADLVEPAMFYAIEKNQLEIVNYLIENGAPVNRDSTIFPLMVAARFGSIQVASYLISKGADPNAFYPISLKSDSRTTVDPFRVIHAAVREGHDEMVRLLKSKGAVIPKSRAVLVAGNSLISLKDVKSEVVAYETYLHRIDWQDTESSEVAEVSAGIHSVQIGARVATSNPHVVRITAGEININVECKGGDLIGIHPVTSNNAWNVIVKKY